MNCLARTGITLSLSLLITAVLLVVGGVALIAMHHLRRRGVARMRGRAGTYTILLLAIVAAGLSGIGVAAPARAVDACSGAPAVAPPPASPTGPAAGASTAPSPTSTPSPTATPAPVIDLALSSRFDPSEIPDTATQGTLKTVIDNPSSGDSSTPVVVDVLKQPDILAFTLQSTDWTLTETATAYVLTYGQPVTSGGSASFVASVTFPSKPAGSPDDQFTVQSTLEAGTGGDDDPADNSSSATQNRGGSF